MKRFSAIGVIVLFAALSIQVVGCAKKPRISGAVEGVEGNFTVSRDFLDMIRKSGAAVTFYFKGYVTEVDDVSATDLKKYFSVGDTFYGFYTFNSSTSDIDMREGVGNYHKPYYEHWDSFVLVFDKDPENLTFKMKAPMSGHNIFLISTFTNSHWKYHNYSFNTWLEGKPLNLLRSHQFSMRLYCLMKDDKLPVKAPEWSSNNASLSFTPCVGKGNRCPVVKGRITALKEIDLTALND